MMLFSPKFLIISTLILLFSHLSQAYSPATYGGFALGYTWTEANVSDPVVNFGGETETPTYGDIKNQGLPFSLYMGMRFHPNYGFEFGYMNYGSINFNKTLTKVNSGNELISTSVRKNEIQTSGFFLSHVLFYNLSQNINLQLKAGVLFGANEYTEDELLTIQPSDTSTTVQVVDNFTTNQDAFAKAHLALAASYRSSDDWSWLFQVNHINFENEDEAETFDRWFSNVSLRYHF